MFESVLHRFGIHDLNRGRWMVLCPAHDDRSPSLSITLLEDKLLMHCFAGCETSSVLVAVGLTMSDLFSRVRISGFEHSMSWVKAKNAIQYESICKAIYEAEADKVGPLQRLDCERLRKANQRLRLLKEVSYD